MGKGDKKSRKGKIAMGSHGVTRPRKKVKKVAAKKAGVAKKATAPAKPAKTAAKAAPKKAAKKAE
jgi:30S ribosomal protein S31